MKKSLLSTLHICNVYFGGIISCQTKSFLLENKEEVLKRFRNSNISNLRILERCLKTFERFNYIFEYFKRNDKYNEFKIIFIESVIISEINHSKGIEKRKWGIKEEYFEASNSYEMFSTFTSFKFLDYYMWNSFVDEKSTIRVIEISILSLTKEYIDDPINKIKYFCRWKT